MERRGTANPEWASGPCISLYLTNSLKVFLYSLLLQVFLFYSLDTEGEGWGH